MAKIKNPEFPADVIKNWIRLRATIEFIGLWEQIDNSDFNMVEFDQFINESGHNYFVITPTKWVTKTNAIGFKTKSGNYDTYVNGELATKKSCYSYLLASSC